MNCADCRKQLSEYLDDMLDEQSRALVQEHLGICDGCKEELSSLRSVVSELGSLASVRAPEDFLDKLHERIETKSSFVEFLGKLFMPMHIKIPLELAGVTAVAVVVFFIVKPHLPGDRLYMTARARPDIESAKKAAMGSEKVSVQDKASGLKHGYKGRAEEATPGPTVAKRAPASPVKPEVSDLKRPSEFAAARAKETITIELALLLKREPAKPLVPAETAMKAGEAPTKKMRAPEPKTEPVKTLLSKPATVGGMRQRTEMMEADVREHEKPAEAEPQEEKTKGEAEPDLSLSHWREASSRVKELIRLAGGKVVSVDNFGTTGRVESITAEIPARNYPSFYEQLGQVASLKGPLPGIYKKDEKPVKIRIRFIPSE